MRSIAAPPESLPAVPSQATLPRDPSATPAPHSAQHRKASPAWPSSRPRTTRRRTAPGRPQVWRAAAAPRAGPVGVAAALPNVPGARIDGVLVNRQIFPGAELIAGIGVDPQFGPLLLVGLGGIFTEVLDDVTLRMPPVDFDDAVDMLSELRGRAILEGVRGMPRGDVHAAAACLVRLGRRATELGDRIAAVDVNPLFVLADGEGVLAGDALVVLR